MKRILATTFFAVAAFQAQAQDLPKGDVSIIVPWTAGTSTDMFARKLAEQLTAQGGMTVIVENLPGAEGLIGGRRVAGAPPDGQTLLYTSSSLTVVQPAIDPAKFGEMGSGFKPVCVMANIPTVLWVRSDAPYDDLKGMIAYAEKAGGLKYAYASGNQNLIGKLSGAKTGMKLSPIPFKSTTEAITAVASGELDFIFNDYVGARPYHEAGKLKPIAITSADRVAYLPEVPTAVEAGYPDLVVVPWSGLFIDAETPDAIVDHYAKAMRAALDGPAIAEMEKAGGFTIGQECGAEALARQQREMAMWQNLVAPQ